MIRSWLSVPLSYVAKLLVWGGGCGGDMQEQVFAPWQGCFKERVDLAPGMQ